MSEVLYKYFIGTINTIEKHIVVVEYHSRSNLLVQAQLMEIQFPTSGVIEGYLSDFDVDEKTSLKYRSLSQQLAMPASDGLFLFSKNTNHWNFLDQKTSSKLMSIYSESPDFEDIVEHICSCAIKRSPKLKEQYDCQIAPEKMIFTSNGIERYCHHCHSYELISNFYSNRTGRSYEAVCKNCYIPHFKPYKLAKKHQSQSINTGEYDSVWISKSIRSTRA